MLDLLLCRCDVVAGSLAVWGHWLVELVFLDQSFDPIKQINVGWVAQCYKPRDLFCQINTDTSEPSQIQNTHPHTHTHRVARVTYFYLYISISIRQNIQSKTFTFNILQLIWLQNLCVEPKVYLRGWSHRDASNMRKRDFSLNHIWSPGNTTHV